VSPPDRVLAAAADPVPSLQRWVHVHALLLVGASALAFAFGILAPLFAVALPSFLWLGQLTAGAWTPSGRPGLANLITLLRLGLTIVIVYALEFVGLIGAGLLALLFLVLDGFDGMVARRRGEAGPFGETFDKETDAFFVLILCFFLFQLDRLSGWILTVGLLRYLFVLWMWWIDAPADRERRSRFARISYVIAVSSLLVAFLPVPALFGPLATFATGLLLVSFARSAWWILRPR
jgi:phosphatidylglycerophosphate synthase